MISVDENIKSLSQTILDEARAEAEKILAEARVKADELRRQAREQASADRDGILAQATLDTERLHSQTIAITQLESRTFALDQREKMLLKVFDTARERLPEIQRDRRYRQTAQLLLREALLQLGSASVTVHADKGTQKILASGALEKTTSDLKIHAKIGKPLTDGIGVVVETSDGRRRYDNTLETRLGRVQDTLRSPVYRLLMGETL